MHFDLDTPSISYNLDEEFVLGTCDQEHTVTDNAQLLDDAFKEISKALHYQTKKGDLRKALYYYREGIQLFVQIYKHSTQEKKRATLKENIDRFIVSKNQISLTVQKRDAYDPYKPKGNNSFTFLKRPFDIVWKYSNGVAEAFGTKVKGAAEALGVPTGSILLAINHEPVTIEGHYQLEVQLASASFPCVLTFEKPIEPMTPSPVFEFFSALRQGTLLDVIRKTNVSSLCLHIPIILSSIRSTPMWLSKYRNALALALNQRLKDNESVRQMVHFELASSKTDRNIYEAYGVNVPTSDNSAVEYWSKFASPNNAYVPGTVFKVPDDMLLYDPIICTKRIHLFKIIKVMKSKTKPLLMRTSHIQNDQTFPLSNFLLKAGDDLRQDACVQLVFNFCNLLWSEAGL